jgi:probable F420-dependent oxidoreductase
MLNFGICFKGDFAPGRTVELAQRAEEGGFTYCWTFDSHVLWKESTVMLTWLAAHTNIMRLGPLVTNPKVRDLSVAASGLATLNVVSGGRAVCGIGRGDSSRRVLGHKPATVANMMEGVEVMRDLAEGRRVDYLGQEQWFPWANPDYKLPMWIAGYGPKVLHACGKHADGIVLQIADYELIPWFVKQVHAGAVEAGRDPKEIKIMAAAPVYVDDDIEECRRHVRWFPAMVGNHVADIVEKHAGNLDEIPKDLTDYIAGRKGYDYRQHADKESSHLDFIPEAIIDRFSVIGPVEAHIEKLKKLREVGVDQFVIYLMSDDEERNLDIYCREIVPEVNKW